MRITENRLRRIIRSVIKESMGGSEKDQLLSQMSPAAQSCIADAERDYMTLDLQDDISAYMSNFHEEGYADTSVYSFGSGVSHEDILLMDEYLNAPSDMSYIYSDSEEMKRRRSNVRNDGMYKGRP